MNAKREGLAVSPEKLFLYEQLVGTIPNLERKGAKMPYTSLNGHMFSFLSGDGSLGIRLPREAREKFLTKYRTTLVVAHGKVMKEYVSVPEELLKNTLELKETFEISYEYVKTLKPKPKKT